MVDDKITKGIGPQLEKVIQIGPSLNFLQVGRERHFLHVHNEYVFSSVWNGPVSMIERRKLDKEDQSIDSILEYITAENNLDRKD